MQHQETAQPRGAGDCPASVDPIVAAGKPASPELATDRRQVLTPRFSQHDAIATDLSHAYPWAAAGCIAIGATHACIGGPHERLF